MPPRQNGQTLHALASGFALAGLLGLGGLGCTETAHEDPASASSTPTAVQAVAMASQPDRAPDDALAATRAAVEKQRAEVEALRAKLAEAEKNQEEAAAKRSKRSRNRTRKASSNKEGKSGRTPIVLAPDTGDPL